MVFRVLRFDTVDEGKGSEDIAFQHAAPFDDMVRFVNKQTTPGFHNIAIEVASFALETYVDPTA